MPEQDLDHISEGAMERFFRSELPREETARVVRHLLTRCAQCLETAMSVGERYGFTFRRPTELPPAHVSHTPTPYEELFLSLLREGEADAMRLAHERLQGIGLLAELETYPPNERLSVIRDNPRFHHWGLFDRMLAKYLEYARNKPQAGIDLVNLALAVLATLPAGKYSPNLLADYRAAAMGALGNAKRLAGFFEEARAALRSAWEHLDGGTGDPLEEANLVSMEASLCRDLGQLEQAAAILQRAINIYRGVGDHNRCASMLIQQGLALGYAEPDEGIRIMQDALALLNAAEEPRLELCARHNLALFLDDAGQPKEALAILEMSRPLYRVFGDRHTQLLLHWLEGRITRSLGDLAEAEAVLQKVWYAFEERGMHYEQTIATVDLVEVYSLRGKLDAAVRLVTEFQPILASWGMHGEGQAMWLLFSRSVAEHARAHTAAEVATFRAIARYFHRAWKQPMKFDEPKPS
jgi:tetratricopeptide (TPR) repeat protein